jgi:uncharacterized protein YjiS (DUF1127 family)
MTLAILFLHAAAARGGFARLHDRIHALWRRWAAHRREAAARREFAQLDASALRDLGLASSEFGSYWAETHGAAECTRRRVPACIRRS